MDDAAAFSKYHLHHIPSSSRTRNNIPEIRGDKGEEGLQIEGGGHEPPSGHKKTNPTTRGCSKVS